MADPLSFTQAWVRATPPGASTAAAYLEIHNAGSSDRLLSLHWLGSAQLEIHTVEMTLVFENAGERTISLPIKDRRDWQR